MSPDEKNSYLKSEVARMATEDNGVTAALKVIEDQTSLAAAAARIAVDVGAGAAALRGFADETRLTSEFARSQADDLVKGLDVTLAIAEAMKSAFALPALPKWESLVAPHINAMAQILGSWDAHWKELSSSLNSALQNAMQAPAALLAAQKEVEGAFKLLSEDALATAAIRDWVAAVPREISQVSSLLQAQPATISGVGTVLLGAKESKQAGQSPTEWFKQLPWPTQLGLIFVFVYLLNPAKDTIIGEATKSVLGLGKPEATTTLIYNDNRQYFNSESPRRKILSADLSIRAGPDRKSHRIDLLPKWTEVDVVETHGPWTRVRYRQAGSEVDREGWAASRYLSRAP